MKNSSTTSTVSSGSFDMFGLTSHFVDCVEAWRNSLDSTGNASGPVANQARAYLGILKFDVKAAGDLDGFTVADLRQLADYIESQKELCEDPHLTYTGAEMLAGFKAEAANDRLKHHDLVAWLKKGSFSGTVIYPDETQINIDLYDDEQEQVKGSDRDRPSEMQTLKTFAGDILMTDEALNAKLSSVENARTKDDLRSSMEALSGSFEDDGSSSSATASTTENPVSSPGETSGLPSEDTGETGNEGPGRGL